MPLCLRISRGCGYVVAGRVARVRARRDGWRVRLAETGGALAAAEIRLTSLVPLPPRGAYVIVRGSVVYDPVHSWYAIDPVESWIVVPATPAVVDSGLFPSSHHGGWLTLSALRA